MKRLAVAVVVTMACLAAFAATTLAASIPVDMQDLSFSPDKMLAETANYAAEIGSDGVQKVQITATSYSFTPNHIIVRVNVPVELSVKKEAGLVPHDITLNAPEAGIKFSESLSTEPVIIRFTPTKAGSYAFFCDKKALFSKSHREKGMEGILEVRE